MASADRTPDFRTKAPDVNARSAKRKRYRKKTARIKRWLNREQRLSWEREEAIKETTCAFRGNPLYFNVSSGNRQACSWAPRGGLPRNATPAGNDSPAQPQIGHHQHKARQQHLPHGNKAKISYIVRINQSNTASPNTWQ